MNLSGVAIAEIKNFYKIKVENLIVIHDELDLPLGNLKIKVGGGSAGHNGIRSIINSLSDNNFIRIRLGIGKPLNKEDGEKFVLSKFSKSERAIIDDVIQTASDAVLEIITTDIVNAMNKFNNN